MAGETTRVMLLPRYSSLVGAATFYTAPMSVRAFYQSNLTMWRGTGNSVTTMSVTPQFSADMRYWLDAFTPMTLPGDTEVRLEIIVNREWMRLAITLTGTNPTAPLWILGEFLRREA